MDIIIPLEGILTPTPARFQTLKHEVDCMWIRNFCPITENFGINFHYYGDITNVREVVQNRSLARDFSIAKLIFAALKLVSLP